MPPPTRKKTRKPARDPVVEQLLQMKDSWKDQVSTLIWDLIAFKRGLNGHGDSEHSLMPTKVTQPFDGSYTELLTEMATEYQSVAQQALEIIQRQNEISREHHDRRENKQRQRMNRPVSNRPAPQPEKKPEPKQENPLAPKFPEAMPKAAEFIRAAREAGTDMFGIANDFESTIALSKLARQELAEKKAGPLSRTMYRLKSPFSNETGRKTRVDMLLRLVDLKHDIEEMQDASVSLSGSDTERLSQAFQAYSSKVFSLHKLFQQYAKELGKGDFVLNRNVLFNEQSKYTSDFQWYQREFSVASALREVNLKHYKQEFHSLATIFKASKDDIERRDIISKMKMKYDELVRLLRKIYRTTQPWSTITELYDMPRELAKDDVPNPPPAPLSDSEPEDPGPEPDPEFLTDRNNAELVTEAHNVLTRMLKRKRMNLPFGDWSASTRSKLFDRLAQTRQTVKAFMKAIEQGNTFEDLYQFLSSLKTDFDEVQRDTAFLLSDRQPEKPKKVK
jgi:hypothetical protein